MITLGKEMTNSGRRVGFFFPGKILLANNNYNRFFLIFQFLKNKYP